MKRITLATLFAMPFAIGLVIWQGADAADHLDPSTGRLAASTSDDIADVYFFHDAGQCVAVLTYGGPAMPAADQAAVIDEDVLYGIHIDEDADNTADVDIWARFGANSDGEYGVQLTNVPGASGVIEGAIETELSDGDIKAWAGLREDPFFFDLDGFTTTISTGDLAFDPTRDFFAGQNVSAIVVEFACSDLGSTTFNVWGTSSRISGS